MARPTKGDTGKKCKDKIGPRQIGMMLRTMERIMTSAENEDGKPRRANLFTNLKDYLPKAPVKTDARGHAIRSSVWLYSERERILK